MSYRFTARTQAAYGHRFSVDASTGDVRLSTDARRLERAEYVLGVVAEDGGVVAEDGGEPAGVTGVSVSIVVVDVNEHAPVIVVNAADVRPPSGGDGDVIELVEHAAANTTVAMLSVTDEDRGDNGRVTCRMTSDGRRMTSDGQGHFTVARLHNTVYRIISNRPLDSRKVSLSLLRR